MDHNIFFSLINAVFTIFAVFTYYPLLKASNVYELHQAINSRPALAKAVARKGNRSYFRVYLYFCISLIAYAFIAVRENVDMGFAAFTLFVLFLVSLSRVWMLRIMLGKP